jgi:hypothetical protein
MMTPIRKLASVACSALLCLSYSVSNSQNLDPTQVYTTGNIVQNTPQGGPTPWVGGVYQDQLTCWSGGDPGYCGPQAIVRPGNVINFSYGSTYLYQQQHISTLLPPETGLQVNGYNFRFTAKNGNGWDDGRTDSLTALVRLWDNTGGKGTGNLLYGNAYSLNYKFNWSNFDYNETFTKPLAVPSIGQVQYGFIGRDNNGWAGPYGPEITSVSFSLKYSVDPCIINILSSPTCPGYLDALAKLITVPTATTSTTAVSDPIASIQTVSPASILVAPTTTSVIESVPTAPVSSPVVSASVSSSAAVSSAAPTANNPQPKIGEVATGGSSKSSMSLSSIMNMVNAESARVGNVEKSVVQQATSEAKAASEKAVQEAESVAGTLTSQSIAGSLASSSSGGSGGINLSQQSRGGSMPQQPASTSVVNLAAVRLPQTDQASTSTVSTAIATTSSQSFRPTQLETGSSSASFALDMSKPPQVQVYTPPAVSYTIEAKPQQAYTAPIVRFESATTLSLATPSVEPIRANNNKQPEIELPRNDGIQAGNRSAINDYLENRTLILMQDNVSQRSTVVNQKAQDNDAAGGVTIAMIAKMPVGYELYSYGIKDAAFYPPKEVYRNQRIVDNVRAERFMNARSDAVHQQMVDDQYNKGK